MKTITFLYNEYYEKLGTEMGWENLQHSDNGTPWRYLLPHKDRIYSYNAMGFIAAFYLLIVIVTAKLIVNSSAHKKNIEESIQAAKVLKQRNKQTKK